ncbi:CRISPR-associated endonuclease/helicase Cas3 [Candidatus Calditenuaceae archaeon HR02]|nr:CRISPR-associated endonuclease/helicase Cas3 [Candidatus Calditenuaceae archaeon HR02]
MGSPSLPEVYERISEIFSPPGPRPLLTQALERLDEHLREDERVAVFLEAPTGYGKSTLSLALYAAIKLGRQDLGQRVIHVLPLRSIGTDLRDKSINRIYTVKSSIGGQFSVLSEKDVGLQQMHSPGSPMLCKRFVITTLDTFLTSFYKMPASEIHKLFVRGTAHYEVPRACIYTSVVVLDEFHLFLSSRSLVDGKSKSLTSAVACIRALLDAGVPVLVMTATMPEVVKGAVMDQLETAGLEDAVVEVRPPPGDAGPVKRRLKVEATKEDPVSLLQHIGGDSRVLILLNTVREAVELYHRLKGKGYSPVLLHSRIVERDREERLMLIREGRERKVFVTTQVVEAGVDVSFDVLITESAPPDSLLQRAGRVARYGGEGEVYVMPVTEGGRAVYGDQLPESSFEYVAKKGTLGTEMLGLIDEAFRGRNPIDLYHYNMLTDIDRYPSCSHKFAMKVWDVLCGFVRDGEQITAIPRQYLNGTVNLQEQTFAMDEDLFLRLVERSGTVEVLLESLERRSVGFQRSHECLARDLITSGIAAVIVDGYDEEVGYVG